MKQFFIATVISFGFCTANAETIQGKSTSWAVPNYKEGYEYTIAANRSYTVTKYLNAAASGKPVRFSATCDGISLGEASRFYEITQKNKAQDLSFNMTFTKATCPSGNISFDITHPGLEVTSDSMNVAILQVLETIDYRVKAIATLRNSTKQTELIKITSLLSNTVGSRESLHCLIHSYENDPLATGIVEELKVQYDKLYSPYVREEITCPTAAQGVLAANVATCQADPLDLSLFCVVYARYTATKTWYNDSIKTLDSLLLQLDSNAQDLAADIEQLKADMTNDLKNTGSPLND